MLLLKLSLGNTLIIFEFVDEIEVFASIYGLDRIKNRNYHILALQPETQAYLKRKNILFFNTTKFFSKESHQNILLKSAEIIEPFRRLLNIRDCLGIKEGYNNAFVFYLRHYTILYLLWQIEVVHNAIDYLKPEKLITVKWNYSLDAMDCIPRNDRYLSIIAEKVAVEKGMGIELLAGRRDYYRSMIKKSRISFLEVIKTTIFQLNLWLFKFRSKDKKFIMYSSKGYNLEDVNKSFFDAFTGIMSVSLSSKNIIKDFKTMLCSSKCLDMRVLLTAHLPGNMRKEFLGNLNGVINRLSVYFSNNENILRYREINFHDLVFLKLRKSMIPFLVNLYGQTYNLDKFMRIKNPALVLSQIARGIFYNLGELTSVYNIPSVLISHGSHVPPSNRYEDIEWGEHGLGLMSTCYKYLAVQSPWALNYLKKRPSSSIPLITGSLLFTKIKKNKALILSIKKKIIPQHTDKIIVLHAGTPKPAQSLRPYVYETVDEYIENINSLIKAVDTLKEVHLIVRFRPSVHLQLNDFLDLLIKSNCYSVHSEGVFDDYLSIADMLVSYSSTTIEEALQNRVPVLQYDSQGKYCHIEGQELDPSLNPKVDSCYYINSEDKLLWGLKWLSENHFSSPIADSLWKRHIFDSREIVELPAYFKHLFDNCSGDYGNKN